MIISTNIKECCQNLKLFGVLNSYEDEVERAIKDNISYSEFLYRLLCNEINNRHTRAKETLLKFASFPKVKTIDEFEYKSSSINKIEINEILSLKFIENAENILFIGPSGVGKTHLAIAIGYDATGNRIKTKFITIRDLILQLKSAKYTGNFDRYIKRVINATRLLIIDEFGYTKLDEEEANLFFEIVNRRYEQSSIIITSNLNFTSWKSVLNDDEALTMATLDRLVHHSHIVNIVGESYRLKEKKKAGIFDINLRLKT